MQCRCLPLSGPFLQRFCFLPKACANAAVNAQEAPAATPDAGLTVSFCFFLVRKLGLKGFVQLRRRSIHGLPRLLSHAQFFAKGFHKTGRT